MSNIDWSLLVTKAMKDEKLAAIVRQEEVYQETLWRDSEMNFIADQLVALDDEDPSALPGTPAQWRAYRIKVRAWVEGAVGFPLLVNRPKRP